jgi:hypothetical protein
VLDNGEQMFELGEGVEIEVKWRGRDLGGEVLPLYAGMTLFSNAL